MKYNIFGLMLLISSFASAMQQNNQNNQNSQQGDQIGSIHNSGNDDNNNNNPWFYIDDLTDPNTPDENGLYCGIFLRSPANIAASLSRPKKPFVLYQSRNEESYNGSGSVF